MLNIIGHRKIYLFLSVFLVSLSILAVGIFGLKQGIDFAGGTLWQFKTGEEVVEISEVESFFSTDLEVSDFRINYDKTNNLFFARMEEIGEDSHKLFIGKLTEKFPSFQELSFQSIGPSVGSELRRNAIWAIVLVLLGISFYVAFAFRHTSKPVSSWKYGSVVLITLFHDVAIPTGMLAVLGYLGRIEMDTNFVVALLVIMGFSVHDTIVVFDRTRENLLINRGKKPFEEIVNESVNQTMTRSINTSLTLIFVLVTLYFLGPINLQYFILTLLVGVITGTYSSIFVASPGLVFFKGKTAQS